MLPSDRTEASWRAPLLPSLVEQILDSLDVRVEAFAVCRIGGDAALVVPPVPELKIIHVLEGDLYLSVEGSETIALPTGSTALIPKNLARTLAGEDPPVRRFDVEKFVYPAWQGLHFLDAFDSDDPKLKVLCGRIEVGMTSNYQAFDGLTHPISATFADNGLVRSAFATMLDETRSQATGSQTLANTLMKVCLVELLRHGLDRLGQPGASPEIFLKPWLGRAVTAIMGQLGASHSVASLAKASGMSRSGFAKAFEETMGATPMDFVARARLARAREMLAAVDDPISLIAQAVGFSSRSHFTQRFRDRYGEGPKCFRHRMRERRRADDRGIPAFRDWTSAAALKSANGNCSLDIREDDSGDGRIIPFSARS